MKIKNKILCFDIDGIICKTKNKAYMDASPNHDVIKLINLLYKENKILIFTARYMGRNKDKINEAVKQGYKKTEQQLKKWNLNYHELRLGKPSYDLFIDDKNFMHQSNWIKLFKKKFNI